MRSVGTLAMLIVLLVGITFGYIMYRQLGTGDETLSATPVFVATGDGSRCADVDLSVKARTLGSWQLVLEDGLFISGSVVVNGGVDSNIGFRIWSPSNRLVFHTPQRIHEQEFELGGSIRGGYTFEFDNRHSAFTRKNVTLVICLA